jgi:hypothetical protein
MTRATMTGKRGGIQTVSWPELGNVGTITPDRSSRRGIKWLPVTCDGRTGPLIGAADDAALWLRLQAKPLEPYAAQRDPVLDLIADLVDQGARATADAAVLASIALQIERLRASRAARQPPALWLHVERFSTWLTALNLPSGHLERPEPDLVELDDQDRVRLEGGRVADELEVRRIASQQLENP